MASAARQDTTETIERPVKAPRKTAPSKPVPRKPTPLVATTSEVLVVAAIAHMIRDLSRILSELSIIRRELLRWADDLDGWVRRANGEGPSAEEAAGQAKRAEENERWAAWQKVLPRERERLILNAVGSAKLSSSEIAAKIRATRDWHVYDTSIKSRLKVLVDRGELQRVSEPRTPGSIASRWMYFRPKPSPKPREIERSLEVTA